MKPYRCLLNEDMGCIGLVSTPECPSVTEPICAEHVRRFVRDAAGTAVDAFLCCPTALRAPLWRSRVRPFWDTPEARFTLPESPEEWTPSERGMYRLRDYILAGGDPVRETFDEVRACGMDFFFSVRMNDWHYLELLTPDNAARFPTIDSFYKEHPEYRIGQDNLHNPVGWVLKNRHQQDYSVPAVREHYLALLRELIEQFDIDGLELDFMRSPNYFPEDRLEEGTRLMTDFIRRVRRMLDTYGAARGKELPLCLHMPHRFAYCAAIGFDLPLLAREGTIQMVNVTSSYFESSVLEIEEFRRRLPGVRIYGDLQGVISNCPCGGGTAERRTTRQIYETDAHAFLKRGADGVALFNYQMMRPLDQPGCTTVPLERDLDRGPLMHLADREYLEHCEKHYVLAGYRDLTWDGALPARGSVETLLRIAEDRPQQHPRARLRVVCRTACDGVPMTVTLNGTALTEEADRGELYPVTLRDGLYPPENTRNFSVPTALLTQELHLAVTCGGEAGRDVEIFGLELALYNT